MRTVFIGAHEEPNGVNSYTYNLALELKKRGKASTVISFGSCNKKTEYNGVPIKQYKTIGGTMTSIPLLYLMSLPYLIKHRKEIDIVMYQTVMFSVIPSLIISLCGLKSCSIIHSLAEDSPKRGVFMKFILKLCTKVSLLFQKNTITVSYAKAEEIFNRYHKKCEVIPCGVYMPEDKVIKSNILKQNNIIEGKYFLTIGRIDPIKNYETLIDAFKKHEHGSYKLVIAGDYNNSYGNSLVKRAKSCKDIIFIGSVQGDTKAALLKHCFAYCLVSSSEGLPIALLEGLSYGKIPIVTQIPAIKEVLSKYHVGLWSRVHDVDDLIKNMLTIETDYDSLKWQEETAKDIIRQNYTWPHICDLYLKFCTKIK